MKKNLGKEVKRDKEKLARQKERVEVAEIKNMKPSPDPPRPAPEEKE